MRRRFYKSIILSFLFCLTGLSLVRSQEASFKQIGINEGLPSTEIYALLTDSKGYLWLSSDAGVCRFNGREFTCFTTADGLKDNTVFNLFEDQKGRIWMTGYNGGVNYYENGKIYAIAASDSLIKRFKGGLTYIFSAGMDQGDTLWLGTNYDLIKIPPQDNYLHFSIDQAFNDSVSFIIKTMPENQVIVSCANPGYNPPSKFKYSGNKWSFLIQATGLLNFSSWSTPAYLKQTSPTHRIVQLKNKCILFNENNLVYCISPDGSMRIIEFGNTVIFLGLTRDGSLWAGLSRGGTLRYPNGKIDEKPEHYFPNSSISSVVQDHEGGTWLSSLEQGIYFIPQLNYATYRNIPALNEKIGGLDALGNKVFVTNNNSQTYMIDPDGTVSWLTKGKETIATRSTEFYNYNNRIFISSNSTGEIDTINKNIRLLAHYKGQLTSSVGMVPLSSNSYLLLSGGQLLKYQEGKYSEEVKIPYRANCIFQSQNKVIYLGTRKGLMIINGKSVTPAFPNDSILSQTITCIEQGPDGILYFGTKKNGAVIADGHTIFTAGIREGLPSDICNAVFPDTSGYVWIGTNKGVTLIRIIEKGRIKVITQLNRSHGLPSNEITRITKHLNMLYIGTKEGLARIDLSKKYYNSSPPPVYMQSIRVNNIPLLANSSSIFDHNQNSFKFHVDCISYKDLYSPVYEFRLMGRDSVFQRSASGTIMFDNLPPGQYKLEVAGFNNNGIRSPLPATYAFTIKEPFWTTWWFIALVILCLVVLIYGFIRMRIHSIKKSEEEKTRINTIIAESQMTALRSQMNPHFIFNAINSIQNYILKENTQQAYDYLSKFSKLIRMVLSNSKESMITLEQELTTLSLYAELELLRFESAFIFDVKVEKGVDISGSRIPGMLLQPFVENAIWHGIMPLQGARVGKVELSIRAIPAGLEICITDNGVGRERSRSINKSATHKSVGMMLSQNRIEILNKATNDKTFSIKVEDLRNSEGEPSGTKIIITLPILNDDEN